MTAILRDQLNRLSDVLTNLKARVRTAVAGELARAVSGAVQEVLRAVVSGGHDPEHEPYPSRSRTHTAGWEDEDDGWGRPRDRWANDSDDQDHDPRHSRHQKEASSSAPHPAAVTTAVAAGVYVARWWLLRKGTLYSAAGLGLGVGVLGVLGGPLAQIVVGLLAATADVLAVTESLGDGAARLEHL